MHPVPWREGRRTRLLSRIAIRGHSTCGDERDAAAGGVWGGGEKKPQHEPGEGTGDGRCDTDASARRQASVGVTRRGGVQARPVAGCDGNGRRQPRHQPGL